MKRIPFFLVFISIAIWIGTACEHELIVPEAPDVIPVDTLPNDTVPLPIDSSDFTGVPCSPDTVYFVNTILPLLVSNCAMSGCHDVQSHREGVILTDYAHIRQKVTPFNPNGSKVYKSLSESGDERMPPPPAAAFTTEQKNLIKTWIQQGALNNECNENYGSCDTTGVTYTNYVSPIVTNYCKGCHSGSNPSGNLKLTTYQEVKANALTGAFYGSIAHEAGYVAMPDGGQSLSACTIKKIKAWIDAGMPQ